MGGKTKQSQRTKNNVRPSSSGRSALLLSNVKLESGVMNGAGQELPALFPSLVVPNIDPLVTPELQLCFKKLNKKDPITKTKALQELSELVSNSKDDDIVAALPSWAHFYKILTTDPDRKVREVTQSCHGVIVGVCGRRVAPHLKQLMPAWLQAQYDEHAPAQANAQNSLAKTFPDSKLPEVISFCKNEVVAHLVDNLIGVGESAFIRKTDTAEEKELQLVRIVTSSLRGVQYTVQHLPGAHHAWLWERLAPLLQAGAFWKRATHADSRIRAAWYGAVGGAAQRFASQFAAAHGTRALRALLAAREPSPVAAAQLWDAVLLFMYNVEEWYQYLDKKELLNKRILDVLESGGWGDARHLSAMLLPLLARLPPDMLTDEFYTSFFDAMFNGLDKKTILSSKSERQSWITSLDECLRYLSIQQQDYVLEIVTSVHRTWLEKVLSDTHEGQIRTNLIKYSANSMAALVKYWLKQAMESHNEKYDQLIRNFWQNVGSTITTQIDKLSTDRAHIGRTIDGHILLLQTLKTSFVQEAKKHQCIKFDGDSPTVAVIAPKETPQCDASIVERYNHNLNDLVEKVCGHYFEFAGKKEVSSPVLTPLITLLVEFDSRNLFTAIGRQFDADSTYGWYERVLRSWLAGDTMRCKAVIDVVFVFMKHLSEQEQDAVFETFKQFPPAVVEWCISLSLSHPHCLSRSARRWMRGSLVDATVASICVRVSALGDCKAKDLLLMCLSNDASGEMIISKSAVSVILGYFSCAVTAVESPALELVAGLAARLATTLVEAGLEDLVLGLFQLSVLVPRGSPRLTLHTWREVRAAWQDGLAALAAPARAAVRSAAAAIVHSHLSIDSNLAANPPPASMSDDKPNTLKSLDMQQIEHVVSLCPYLLSNQSAQDGADVAAFSRRLLCAAAAPAAAAVERAALRHAVLRADISCPLADADLADSADLAPGDLHAFVNDCVFRTMYLKTVLLHKVDEDLEDTWCDDLMADEYFVEEFCRVLHDFMVVCSMFDAYAFSPHYILIKETKMKLDILIQDIKNECSADSRRRVLRALGATAAARGYFWAFARRWFELDNKLNQTENTQITEKIPSEPATCEVKAENGQGVTGSAQSEAGSGQSEVESGQTEAGIAQSETRSGQNEGEIVQSEAGNGQNEVGSGQSEGASGQSEVESGQNEAGSRQSEAGSRQSEVTSRQSEALSEQTEAGTVQSEAGSGQNESESGQSEAGSRQNEAASVQSEAGIGQSETGSRQSETVSGQSETSSAQSEAGSGQNEMGSIRGDTGRSQNVEESNQNITDDNPNEVEDTSIEYGEKLDLEKNITGSGYFHTLQANDHWDPAPGAALRTKYLVMVRSLHAAHPDLAPALAPALAPELAPALAPTLAPVAGLHCSPDLVINLYYAHNHVMLYEMDLTKASWSHVASNAAIMEYLAELVATRGWELAAHHWDFTTITLCHALTSALRSKSQWGRTKVALFTRAALRLHAAAATFVRGVAPACLRRQPAPHVAHLPTEWRDIFAPDLEFSIFSIVLHVLDTSGSTAIAANHIAVLDALIRSVRLLEWTPLPAAHRAGACALRRLAGAACAALCRPAHYCHLYLAYELLRAVHEPLVLEDAAQLAAWSAAAEEAEAEAEAEGGEERGRPQLSLQYYDDAYRRLQDIVDTAVAHVKVCEATCALVPFSDVHVLALGWLLLADALAEQARLARGDLRHHYIQIYRERKYAEPLLTAALRLLPARVFAHAQGGAASPPPRDVELFARLAPLDVYEYCAAETVSAAACRAVALCVVGAGGGDVRGWRGAAPHRHARLLDDIVRGYITPNAVKEQFLQVQQRAAELEDTEVTLHWSTHEATCILTVEERPIELGVQLARDHPLGLPRFTAQENAPATNTNWLVMYMGYQNGSLLNALKMWTGAVNSKVERSAQCYICYCRLHFSSGRLPAVQCYQCRNKYHKECLRKWFKTSSKSNCPLCRASF